MRWILPPPSRISRAGTPTTYAPGRSLFQNALGFTIGGGVQRRVDDAIIVGDKEVSRRNPPDDLPPRAAHRCRSRRRRTLRRSSERARLGQLPHFQLATLASTAASSTLRGLWERAYCLGIGLVVGPVQGRFTRTLKQHMLSMAAVGLVHVDAFVQPDEALRPNGRAGEPRSDPCSGAGCGSR